MASPKVRTTSYQISLMLHINLLTTRMHSLHVRLPFGKSVHRQHKGISVSMSRLDHRIRHLLDRHSYTRRIPGFGQSSGNGRDMPHWLTVLWRDPDHRLGLLAQPLSIDRFCVPSLQERLQDTSASQSCDSHTDRNRNHAHDFVLQHFRPYGLEVGARLALLIPLHFGVRR